MSIYIELKSCTLIQSRLCTVAAAAVDGYTGKRAGPTPHVYAGGRPSLSRAGELHPTPSWVHGWGGPSPPHPIKKSGVTKIRDALKFSLGPQAISIDTNTCNIQIAGVLAGRSR